MHKTLIVDLVPRSEEEDALDVITARHFRQSGTSTPVLTLENQILRAGQTKSYLGYDIPHFHRRQRSGELLPHTPFTVMETSYTAWGFRDYTDGSTRYFTEPPGLWWNDASLTPADLNAYIPLNYDQFVQEAAADIYSSGFDALTFLAELKDITKLYTSIMQRIAAIKKLKRLKGLTLKKLLRGGVNDWLEGRYGIRPLIYDIIGINELIKNWNDRRTRRSSRSGRNWLESDEVITSVSESTYVKHTKTVNDKVSIGIRGSVTADIEVPRLQFNPLMTAWELIPFSFVIDWLLNVGNTIAALSFLGRAKDYTASASYLIKLTRTTNYQVSYMKPGWTGNWWQYSVSSAVYKVRTPCTVPYFPHIIAKITPLKVLDSIGLILQQVK